MDTLSPASLPDDVDALKAIIASMQSEHTTEVKSRYAELHALTLMVEKLKHQLSVLRRGKFGASGEGLEQLELLIEAVETEQAEISQRTDLECSPDEKVQPKRKPLPDHLPRQDVIHQTASDCDHCGKPMRQLGEDVREQLEYVPGPLSSIATCAQAIRYAITRMKRMRAYLDNGICELDNNTAERSVRGIAVGRKNYMFAGSDNGGERAAAIYTLIESAKLNNINPQAWLTDVLKRVADHPINKIDDLLPWKFEPVA